MRRIPLLALLRLTCWLVGVFSSVLAGPLQWRLGPGYRVADLSVPAGGHSGFTLVNPPEIGIPFTNSLSVERAQRFQNLMNGSGLAAADVDGDGLVDLYFCHKQAANRLYRNLGNGRFEDVTRIAGVACTYPSNSTFQSTVPRSTDSPYRNRS